MKAVIQTEYGSTDILRLEEVDKPILHDNDVLVRVHAASVNAGDWHLMRGDPFLMRLIFGGLLKPKLQTLGFDVAGQVEAVGKDVTQFKPGDEVFGDLSECGFGAFAEYACAAEEALILKPESLTFEEAATIPGASVAALQALRDCGHLQPGQKVLINGASGGVGSFAVQIAKTLGAEVTGVCSTTKVEMVRSLGADYVIDYTQEEVLHTAQHYDLIIDAAAYRSVLDYQSVLSVDGTYVLIGGSTARFFQVMLLGPLISRIMRRKVKFLAAKPNQDDLRVVRGLVESGAIAPYIDRRYPLSEVPAAIRHLEQRQVQGKVAIHIL